MPLISPVGLKSFNDVPDKIPPIPPAIYLLEIMKVDPGTVNDKPVTQLSYRVSAGMGGAETPQAGKMGRHTLFHPHQSDSPSQIERAQVNAKQCFLAFGVQAEPEGSPNAGQFNTDNLLGRKGYAEIFTKVDGGVEYSNIKMFLRTDGSRF